MKKVSFENAPAFGLIRGRHEINDVENYIFENAIEDVFDTTSMKHTIAEKLTNVEAVKVYVTGLTIVTVEVIKYCYENDIALMLYHYNNATNSYVAQLVNDIEICSFCGRPHGKGWTCQNCGAE